MQFIILFLDIKQQIFFLIIKCLITNLKYLNVKREYRSSRYKQQFAMWHYLKI
jgi:hypothetical protein